MRVRSCVRACVRACVRTCVWNHSSFSLYLLSIKVVYLYSKFIETIVDKVLEAVSKAIVCVPSSRTGVYNAVWNLRTICLDSVASFTQSYD